jgi:hypothetical protein
MLFGVRLFLATPNQFETRKLITQVDNLADMYSYSKSNIELSIYDYNFELEDDRNAFVKKIKELIKPEWKNFYKILGHTSEGKLINPPLPKPRSITVGSRVEYRFPRKDTTIYVGRVDSIDRMNTGEVFFNIIKDGSITAKKVDASQIVRLLDEQISIPKSIRVKEIPKLIKSLQEARVRHPSDGKNSTYKSKNLDMSPEVYKLRRMVMDYVYEAKRLTGGTMPRVEVRITDNADYHAKNIAGLGSMDKLKALWIPSDLLKKPATYIKYVVFHEILHAVYKIQHDNDSYLMAPSSRVDLADSKKIDADFLSFVNSGKRDTSLKQLNGKTS